LAAVAAAFLLVVVLTLVDLVGDLANPWAGVHVLIEGGVVLVGLGGGVMAARRLFVMMRAGRAARAEVDALQVQLRSSEVEAVRWRTQAHDLLQGLAIALDQQFERWALSPAEKEVALLLLKGLSHREVAAVRSITEATARQQARAVYKKSGLAGRNDLAAFFLEDLLVPGGDAPRPPRPTS
jgi:DNA-binding CsgD family transcriptional regulator